MSNLKAQILNLKLTALPVRPLLLTFFCLLPTAYCLPPTAYARSATWEKQKTGTFAWLRAVFFVDERRGWAAGNKGALLKTADGGATWELRKRPTEDALRDIFFQDEFTGWLVCERSMYLPTAKEESVSYLLRTTDGGDSWKRVEVTRGADVDVKLTGIRFADAGHGWAYGELGALFVTGDGGATWTRQRVPTRHLLLGAAFLDERTGWLSGGGMTVLKTTDGGASWREGAVLLPPVVKEYPKVVINMDPEKQPEPDTRQVGGRRLNAVWFADARRGWAVGGEGVILATSDGGATWRPQRSNVGDDLYDVKFFDAREGWAVGRMGAMLHTADGGRSWTDEKRLTTHALERLFVVGRRAWAVGFGGTVVALNP